MTSPIDTAYVEIKPQSKNFTNNLRRDVNRSLKGVEKDTNNSMNKIRGMIGKALSGLTRIGTLGAMISKFAVQAALLVTKLTAVAGAVGAVSVALAGAAAGIAKLFPLINQFVGVLVQAAGALAILPGAIGVLVSVVAALKIGLSGVGDAMKAIASGDADKLNEALKKLAPNARSFVRELAKLQKSFTNLKMNVQNALFKDFSKTLIPLIKDLLPGLRSGLTLVAQAINGSLVGAFKTLKSVATKNALSDIFVGAAMAVRNLGVALGPVIKALLDAAAVGSQIIGELSVGVSKAIGDFAAHISELAKSGGLRKIILDGIDALKQFLGLAGDIIGVIKGIFGAAGQAQGGGIFGFFDRLNKLINSADVQRSLTSLFEELGKIGKALLPVFVSLAKALVPVAKGIAAIALAFGPILEKVATQLGDALAALAPAIIALGPAVAALGNALVPLAQAITAIIVEAGPVFTDVITKLGQALTFLGPGITALLPAIGALGNALVPLALIIENLLIGVGPGLAVFLNSFAKALLLLLPAAVPVGKALGDILKALAPLLEVLGGVLGLTLVAFATELSAVARAAGPLIKIIGQIATMMFSKLTPVVLQLATSLLPIFADAGIKLAEAFAPLIPVFARIIETGVAQMISLLPQLVGIFAQLLPVLISVGLALANTVLAVLVALEPHLPELREALLKILVAFSDLIVAIAPFLPILLPLIAQILILIINSGMLQRILITVMLAMQLVTVAVRIVAEAFRFVQNPIATAIGWVEKIAAKFSGFSKTSREAIGKVGDTIRGLPTTIKNAVSGFGNLLYSAGRNLIQGLINGVSNMIGALRDKFSFVTSLIPSWKGPMTKDLKLLKPSGQAIMRGLTRGIQAGLPELRAELAGITADIGGNAGGNVDQSISFGAGAVSMSFNGSAPTQSQAMQAGQAVGAGIASILARRNARLAVRTI